MNNEVLVLGARGRFGNAVSRAFAAAGWRVHAQVRRPDAGFAHPAVREVAIPLTDPVALAAAAPGARVVVHALNPPYAHWAREVPALGEAALAVATALNARLMLPGNVYNFGDPIPARLLESTPFAPNHGKARLRCDLESRLRQCAGVRSVVVRGGDFFGAGRGSWIDQVILARLARGRIVYPGPLDVCHAWAYLPDYARTFVALAAREASLPPHARLHFPGHAVTGRQFVAAFDRAAGELGILAAPARLAGLPWQAMRAFGLVSANFREIVRMRYLWDQPHELISDALPAAIGEVPATPLDVAALHTVADLFSRPLPMPVTAHRGEGAPQSRPG